MYIEHSSTNVTYNHLTACKMVLNTEQLLNVWILSVHATILVVLVITYYEAFSSNTLSFQYPTEINLHCTASFLWRSQPLTPVLDLNYSIENPRLCCATLTIMPNCGKDSLSHLFQLYLRRRYLNQPSYSQVIWSEVRTTDTTQALLQIPMKTPKSCCVNITIMCLQLFLINTLHFSDWDMSLLRELDRNILKIYNVYFTGVA